MATNWADAVRGSKHVGTAARPLSLRGQARRLLARIGTSTVVGLRDRALIAMITYTFTRIGAVVGMRVEDYFPRGKRYYIRESGKQHEMPVHHKIEEYIDEYTRAGIGEDEQDSLFRTAARKRAF